MRPSLRLSFGLSVGIALTAAAALLGACGGSPAPEAQSPEPTTDSATDTASVESEDADEAPAKPAPRCDDGTCFECGEGLCPQGFYCDRDAAGGPACSWLPNCAKTPTCACLKKTLGKTCTCEDGTGGPSVSCQ